MRISPFEVSLLVSIEVGILFNSITNVDELSIAIRIATNSQLKSILIDRSVIQFYGSADGRTIETEV